MSSSTVTNNPMMNGFDESTYIFNPSDIITSSGLSYATMNKKQVDSDVKDLLENASNTYVKRTGDVMLGTLTFRGSMIFNDDSIQNTAFTNAMHESYDGSMHNTAMITNMSDESGDMTMISGALQVTGDLMINDNAIAFPKVAGLQTRLDNIDDNIESITDDVTDIQTLNTTQSGLITGLRTDVDNNTANIATNTTNIATNSTDITNLTSSKHDLINSGNKLSSDYVSVSASTLTTKLSSIDTSITNLTTEKQDVIDADNKLDGAFVDLTSMPLQYIDISDYLQDQLDIINGSISDHSDLIVDLRTDVDNHSANITDLQSDVLTNTNDITSLTSTVNGHTTTLSSHTTTLSSHTSSISTLNTNVSTNASNISSLTTTVGGHTTTLATHTTDISDLQDADDTLQDNIDLKQDILDVTNRLNCDSIGNGDVSNNEMSTLQGISTGLTIQSQLNTKADLASPTFTGTVSGITKSMVGLGNCDNTSDANKPVSTATQTAIDLKANIASPTFTGTVSGITKSMVGLGNCDNTSDANKPVSTATQTELDLKANIASPTFTGTVSGITKSMVGLGNCDNTSDANKPVSTATQTALDLKANIASPTFTGTVSGITKSMVGLGNCDNTSDANKPISTATQTALDAKHATINSSNRLNADLVGSGSVSNTEYGYLDGVTSAIQTQLDAKHATINSSNRLNADLIGSGSVSNTEFGYLDGVTSSIQTQINSISGGGLATQYLTASDCTSGVYTISNNTTKIFVKNDTLTNSTYLSKLILHGVNGVYSCVVPDGSGKFYLGYGGGGVKYLPNSQTTTTTAPFCEERIVIFDPANGSVEPVVGTTAFGIINCMMLYSGYLYIGGSYTNFGGIAANNLCKMNISTGAISAIGTGCDGIVNCMFIDGTDMWLGGNFANANGSTSTKIAKFTLSGETWTQFSVGPSTAVLAMVISNASGTNYAYIGGNFGTVNSVANTTKLCRMDTSTGVFSSIATVTAGAVNHMNLQSNKIYIVGTQVVSGYGQFLTIYDASTNTLSTSTLQPTNAQTFSNVTYKNSELYITGSSLNLQGIAASFYGYNILVYHVTNDTWRGINLWSGQNCPAFFDGDDLYCGSSAGNGGGLIKYTKNWIQLKYNSKIVSNLFINGDATLVNCCYDGSNYFMSCQPMNNCLKM